MWACHEFEEALLRSRLRSRKSALEEQIVNLELARHRPPCRPSRPWLRCLIQRNQCHAAQRSTLCESTIKRSVKNKWVLIMLASLCLFQLARLQIMQERESRDDNKGDLNVRPTATRRSCSVHSKAGTAGLDAWLVPVGQ